MTRDVDGPRPTVRVVPEHTVPEASLGEEGTQRVLLGAPRHDGSPVLLGITRVAPGRKTSLIEHDTAEVAYVVAGAGAMVTDDDEHPFVAGSALLIGARCWHAIRAGDEEVVMVFGFPTPDVPPTRNWPA